MARRIVQRVENASLVRYFVLLVLFPSTVVLLDLPSGFPLYADLRRAAQRAYVRDGARIYPADPALLCFQRDPRQRKHRTRRLEGVESPASGRAREQHRACVYPGHQLCLFLHDGRAVLRLLGQRHRGLAVCEYGVQPCRHDVHTAHLQPYLL